jgi:hypothetical protein
MSLLPFPWKEFRVISPWERNLPTPASLAWSLTGVKKFYAAVFLHPLRLSQISLAAYVQVPTQQLELAGRCSCDFLAGLQGIAQRNPKLLPRLLQVHVCGRPCNLNDWQRDPAMPNYRLRLWNLLHSLYLGCSYRQLRVTQSWGS